jgi:hypothetical protein
VPTLAPLHYRDGIRKRAPSNTRLSESRGVGEAPVEGTIGELGAMSGYRVLERAVSRLSGYQGSAVPSTCSCSRSRAREVDVG